jgi:hypothetical protein
MLNKHAFDHDTNKKYYKGCCKVECIQTYGQAITTHSPAYGPPQHKPLQTGVTVSHFPVQSFDLLQSIDFLVLTIG